MLKWDMAAFKPSKQQHPDSPDGVASSRLRCGHWVSVEDGKVVVDGKRIAKISSDVIAWDADDKRVVLAIDKGTYGTIVEVAIGGGKPRDIFVQQVHANGVSRLASIAIGADGDIVAGSIYHLMLVRDGAIAHELAETATSLWRVGDGFLVEKPTQKIVYRIEKAKLKRGEKIKSKSTIYAVWSDDDRWFAELDESAVEVTGV